MQDAIGRGGSFGKRLLTGNMGGQGAFNQSMGSNVAPTPQQQPAGGSGWPHQMDSSAGTMQQIGRGGTSFGKRQQGGDAGGQGAFNQPMTSNVAPTPQQQPASGSGWNPQMDSSSNILLQRSTSFGQRQRGDNMGGRGAFNQSMTSNVAPTPQQQPASGSGWNPQMDSSAGNIQQIGRGGTSFGKQQQGGDADGQGAFNQSMGSNVAPTPQQQPASGSGWPHQMDSSAGTTQQLGRGGTSSGKRLLAGNMGGQGAFNQSMGSNMAPTPQQQPAGSSGWPHQMDSSAGTMQQIGRGGTSFGKRQQGGDAAGQGAFNQSMTSNVAPTPQQQPASGSGWPHQMDSSAGTMQQIGRGEFSFGKRPQGGDADGRGAFKEQPTATSQHSAQGGDWAQPLKLDGTAGGVTSQRIGMQSSTSFPQAARSGIRHGGGHIGGDIPPVRQQQSAWGERTTFEASSSAGNVQSKGGGGAGGGGSRSTLNPLVRSAEQLYMEDTKQAAFYDPIDVKDEEVSMTGVGEPPVAIEKWEELKPAFNPKILDNLRKCNYVRPRKIQSYAIPAIMEGRDVKGQSETGSGKTAAFLLPLIQKIAEMDRQTTVPLQKPSPIAIIVEPTRELCLQVYEQAMKLSNETGVRVVKTYGEYNMRSNLQELNAGCDILCATPMRLHHFYFSKLILVDKLQFFVLDEADTLLEGTFLEAMRSIVNSADFPSVDNRQTILFSATYPEFVESLSNQMLRPDHVKVSNKKMLAANTRIKQDFLAVGLADKKEKLLEVLKNYFGQVNSMMAQGSGDVWSKPRVLVFVKFKREADMLAIYLSENDLLSVAINSDLPQTLRERALQEVRENKTSVLVATDVMARGMDIQHLDYVINYDLPDDCVTYVHRIGRTGRMGPGVATSFFDENSDDVMLAGELVKLVQDAGQQAPDFLVRCADGAPRTRDAAPFNAPPSNSGAAAGEESKSGW